MSGSRTASMGRLFCLASAAIGVLGLVGWTTGATSLTTFVPGRPSMMPSTALALVLIGVAGALQGRATGMRGRLGGLAAVIVLAIGAGMLAEHALGLDLRIDHLLLRTDVESYAGRPSLPTALALALLAGAVLLFDVRPSAHGRPAEWLALSSALIAFTALLGQIFGSVALYRLAQDSVVGVALPTALGLLGTSAGLLLERSDAGIMRLARSRGPGGMLLRRLGFVVLLTPAALGLMVTKVFAILGVEDVSLVVGTLATASTVVGMLLLAITAVSLERSHEVLESNRARTHALVEQASDGIFVADSSGRYTDVNCAGCRMLGYTREEIIGKTIMDLIPPQNIERLGRQRERLLEGATDVSEWMLRSKDGSYVSVEVSAKILPDGRWQGLVRDIRERNRARDQLRESQERLELALRGADLAAWDWNIATGEVVFNARWAEIRGFRSDEIRPHVDSWIAGVHPEDWPGVWNALSEHFEGRASEYQAEHRVRTRSDEWRWILDRGRVFVRDEEGRPLRMVGTELDITERKQLEEELRRSEAQASGIISISADAIISTDEGQQIVLYNEGAEKIFGYTKAEVLGAPLDMLIPERFRSAHRLHVERFAAGGAVARRMGDRNATITGLRKNGEEFAADAAISKLEVGGKRILTVALHDVTEQRRFESEQELLADVGAALTSSLEYEDALSTIAQLVVRDHAHLCIVDIVEETGETRRLSVVCREPSVAWVCDLLMRMDPDRKGPHLIHSALETGRPVLIQCLSPETIVTAALAEAQLRPLQGLGPASAVAVPLLAHGKVLGAIALVLFASPRAYGPADVRVAERVAERAALSVERTRLHRAARKAIQARADVLAIVAHDLRNPLATILLQTALLSGRGCDPDRRASCAEAIERAATRANRLIEDLLDVSCIEAGHFSVEPVRLPIANVLVASVEAQRALASSACLELWTDVTPDLPDVWADRDRLLQVFENLISNAIKFSRPGGRVTVGAAPRNGDVVFRVEDTGTGIAAEDLPHLFDRFWQGKKADRAGAGLGLAIVKGIVEAHGGCVWAASRQGCGSSIFFTIPATPAREKGVGSWGA